MESLNLFLIKFTDENIAISGFIILFLLGIIVVYWIYNRRKFHKLSHQIPASVVKNYLDSIIQNSTALKSSLFRGGGLELGDGIPAVVPVTSLPQSSINVQGDFSEELNQKNAEIATLKALLGEKDKIISELEKRLQESLVGGESGGGEEVAILQEELGKAQATLHEKDDEITSLKEQLAGANDGDSSSGEIVESLTKERDDLKERLMEYEIIEEDLANLKRLQQENGKLKEEVEALKSGSGSDASETVAPAKSESEAEVVVEPEPIAEKEPVDEIIPDEAEDGEEVPGESEVSAEQKTADELLSEFEKMLG